MMNWSGVEGNGRGLFQGAISESARKDWRKRKGFESGEALSKLTSEQAITKDGLLKILSRRLKLKNIITIMNIHVVQK
jgi:hypothetical protein